MNQTGKPCKQLFETLHPIELFYHFVKPVLQEYHLKTKIYHFID
jgi:hypothetical protein